MLTSSIIFELDSEALPIPGHERELFKIQLLPNFNNGVNFYHLTFSFPRAPLAHLYLLAILTFSLYIYGNIKAHIHNINPQVLQVPKCLLNHQEKLLLKNNSFGVGVFEWTMILRELPVHLSQMRTTYYQEYLSNENNTFLNHKNDSSWCNYRIYHIMPRFNHLFCQIVISFLVSVDN